MLGIGDIEKVVGGKMLGPSLTIPGDPSNLEMLLTIVLLRCQPSAIRDLKFQPLAPAWAAPPHASLPAAGGALGLPHRSVSVLSLGDSRRGAAHPAAIGLWAWPLRLLRPERGFSPQQGWLRAQ